MDKYYKPEIEEFHVGFEYEVKILLEGEEKWAPFILKHPNYEWMDVRIEEGYRRISVPECVRVKYLDKNDIESLGWRFIRNDYDSLDVFILEGDGSDVTVSEFKLTINTIKSFIDITYTEEHLYTPTVNDSISYRVFQGTIKNKSELKTLMKQLGIL